MPRPLITKTTTAALAVATLTATFATALPAAASEPAGPAGPPALQAASAAQVAQAPQGQPVHAVLTLGHGRDAHQQVAQWARHHGFTITHHDGDTVVVEGSQREAAKAFGTQVRGWAKPQRTDVPDGLQSAVTNVAGFDTEPLFHPMTIPGGYTGQDVDSAYAVAPSSTAGQGLTIATIQFSGWNPSDATTYAQAAGITLAPGQITSVPVNGASTTTPDGSGDIEVALDVEAILAVAPAAKQRVYVTTNDYAGSLAVYKQVAADAANGLVQLVSMSWGMCEADANSYTLNSLGAPIQQIVDAGASFFASSGDYGPYGCSYPGHQDSRLSTVFPASHPAVVGVGGTTLNRTSTGWSETGWSGSGGGASATFTRPAYQSSVGQSGSARLVPDVAALADANTGLAVYIGSAGGWVRGGGTSLASPLWAGTLGASMSAVGRITGVGDIHGKLYAAGSAFRDVTSGSTGPYAAKAGYDLVTGLGTPQWSKLAPALGISAGATTGTATGPTTTSEPAPTDSGTQSTRSTDPTPAPTSDPTPAPQPATGPRTTANACPAGEVPSDPFVDVQSDDVHSADIACAAWWGVAHGVTTDRYAPAGALTRAQMAAFLTRVVTAAGGSLPSDPATAFPDVVGDALALPIDQLAAVGIVQGNTDGLYHPGETVSRAEMAMFVSRTYAFLTGTALGPSADGFPDVPADSVFAAAIDVVAGTGISVGYTDGTFRPGLAVSREQVASFLTRLLDLLVSEGVVGTPA